VSLDWFGKDVGEHKTGATIMNEKQASKLAVFEGKRIRKTLHEGEWWFSVIDVIEALVGGDRPRKYWNDLKKKLLQEGYEQLSDKIGQLILS
jgi:DNA-damage-inducible protein D